MGPQLPDRGELQVLSRRFQPHTGPAAPAAGFFMRAAGAAATIPALEAAPRLHPRRPALATAGWVTPRPYPVALATGRRIAIWPTPYCFPRADDARGRGRAGTPPMREGIAVHRQRDARCAPRRTSAPPWFLAAPRRRSACGARWPVPGGTHFVARGCDAQRSRGGDRSPPLQAAWRVATLSRAVRSTPRARATAVRRPRRALHPGRAWPAAATSQRAADAAPAPRTG